MRASLGIIVMLGVLLSPALGAAQIEGKLKLGLDVSALTFTSYDIGGGGSAATEITAGPFPPANFVSVLAGVPASGLDVAYGVSDAIVVGTLVRLGMASDDNGGGSSTTAFAVGLQPHVDYVLLPQHSFRPFVGALVGVNLMGGDERKPFNTGDNGLTFLSVGVHVGGYGFVSDTFTVSPRVAFTYNQGVSDTVKDWKLFAIQLQVEIAGWM